MNQQLSFLNNIDPIALDKKFNQFLDDPNSVDKHWQNFFNGFQLGIQEYTNKNKSKLSIDKSADKSVELVQKETAVAKLIQEYRNRGHLFAKTNPIRSRRVYSPPITIDRFGLIAEDLNIKFHAGELIQIGYASLREIINHLSDTYLRSIGSEFTMIQDPHPVGWITEKIEKTKNQPNFSKSIKIRILKSLCHAVLFEKFTHTRFIGQKRFSLEGLEALIPALDTLIQHGAKLNIKEFVVGMAHRGRLNVLGNNFGKEFKHIFSEFDARGYASKNFLGDVKYHLGYSANINTASGSKVHLNMLPNPSHLESVNPVLAGATRAKMDFRYESNRDSIVPILIHGDASIAGQGIIYELIQMSNLQTYSVGGTIHIVTNNQIGFTTNYLEGRSSIYCTDIAKITNSPVFHVNGDDIEAVVHAVLIALEFRKKFHRDVFIDILGYRKHGHNEGDDPNLTQPILYDLIKKHDDPYEIYSKKLIAEGIISEKENEEIKSDFWNFLDKELAIAKKKLNTPIYAYLKGDWNKIKLPTKKEIESIIDTSVNKKTIESLCKKLTLLPKSHKFIKKIHSIQEQKHKLLVEQDKINWASAEALAFGTLLIENNNIRFTGQDILRGTFSQRHLMFRSIDESLDYYPLKNLSKNQGRFMASNSLLSEYAVLGFEYGYSLALPDCLTLWEAQFGDFANGAQIIIDQFISSAETKWQRMNGIVLLLPHGQEGQGPEHSSGKIERFLQLCADYNLIVTNISTPANYFHVLRRQLHANYRKPLIIFTPKSLLRHPECISSINELTNKSHFQMVLDDTYKTNKKINKVLICSGKIYYELDNYRKNNKINDVVILRIEQLYPFPQDLIVKLIGKYKCNNISWVQEEPENQGALSYIFWKLQDLKYTLSYVSRPACATTATGFSKVFKEDQEMLVKQAFK